MSWCVTETALRQPAAKAVLWLSTALSLFALGLLWHYASQPYLLDIIGRTLRIDAIALAQGQPMYSAPAVSMPYTPGFVLLNAAVIKLSGFSYFGWNAVWALGGVIFLLGFSLYFWWADKVFTPFVAAGLLACLFPFIWARGDIYAIGLTGMGMLLLQPLLGHAHGWKTALAVVLFALALFFKQTMLPIIVAIVWLSNDGDLFARKTLSRNIGLMVGVSVLFGVMMLGYIWAWHENARAVLAVLTVGKGHAIHWQNILFYAGMYVLVLLPPVFYIWRNARWAAGRMAILLLLGTPLILFSAKDGGGWHHFLGVLLPWLWLLVLIRRDPRMSQQAGISILWLMSLSLFALAFFYFPFSPGIADAQDVQAMQELRLQAPAPSGEGDHFILVLDASKGLAFPESLYLKGSQPRYVRGALEEWSGAEKRLPEVLLEDVHGGRFARVFWRKGERLELTAYGISYQPLYNALDENYAPCPDVSLPSWAVLCRRDKNKTEF
jgi:hypothetical protein